MNCCCSNPICREKGCQAIKMQNTYNPEIPGTLLGKNSSCKRCGHLFYSPDTIIEDYRQRSAEWEEIAKRHETEVKRLRDILDELSVYY